MADDYVNFDHALKELKLTADQLKRLVSEGEIRAIRGDNNSMKFRREEIERLKQDTGKTIQYTQDSSDTLTDDLLFDDANDLEVGEEGMQTAQITSDDTFVGDDAPSPKGGKGGSKPPAKSAPPAKGGGAKPPAAAKPASTGGAIRGSTQTARKQSTRSATRSRATGPQAVAAPTGSIPAWVVALMIVTFIVTAYSMLVWWDISKDTSSSPTEPISKWAFDTFGTKK